MRWNEPKFGAREKELVNEVLDSGYVSEGSMTNELKEKLAKIVGCKYIIMTTSCTAALYLAIEADKRIRNYSCGQVMIPDLTCVGTKNAVELANLKPVYCDVDRIRFNDLYLKSSIGIKIVIPVNILGRSISPYVINESKGHTVICDNAGCLGSDVPIGKVGCYSLQANKIISCGQGGFCATNNKKYADEIRKLKDFGRENKEQNNTEGFNFKFNDILAAVVLGQLEKLNERRKLLTTQYFNYQLALEDFGKFIHFSKCEIPLWIEFITEKRDELFDYLVSKNIQCRKPWEAITGLPNAKYYSDNAIWLPNGPCITDTDIKYICKQIKQFYENE